MRDTWVWPWVGKIPWRRERLPTPLFWPGEFHGQRSLAGYSPWGPKELDTSEWLSLDLWYLPVVPCSCCVGWRQWDPDLFEYDFLTPSLVLFPQGFLLIKSIRVFVILLAYFHFTSSWVCLYFLFLKLGVTERKTEKASFKIALWPFLRLFQQSCFCLLLKSWHLLPLQITSKHLWHECPWQNAQVHLTLSSLFHQKETTSQKKF